MRTVSHTLARQHRRCAALFYSGDSLRFPAYNGNEMPRRVSTGDACAPFYGLRKLFFLCAVLRGCAGVEGAFALGGVPSCPREEKRLPRPLPARGARLQTEAEPGYFPPQTLRLSAGRSNHSGLFRWKNLAATLLWGSAPLSILFRGVTCSLS